LLTTRVEIRDLRSEHWPEVAAIFRAGIETGNATFETAPPSWDEWDRAHVPGLRLVAVDDGSVLGWAALARVSSRPCYAGVAEVSVYVAPAAAGKGIGKALLEGLIARAEDAGIWTIQAGIFPENTASLALHEKCGFRVVGTRERIGQMHGEWRDVVLLERRSGRIG
jgi:L-amino acid N-acyltransferase YncA